MFILDDLLIKLPAKGLISIFEKIHDMAMDELYDEARIKEELMGLQTLYEFDQIAEEEFQKKEAELLERLTEAREAHSGAV